MDIIAIESFIVFCDDMMIATESTQEERERSPYYTRREPIKASKAVKASDTKQLKLLVKQETPLILITSEKLKKAFTRRQVSHVAGGLAAMFLGIVGASTGAAGAAFTAIDPSGDTRGMLATSIGTSAGAAVGAGISLSNRAYSMYTCVQHPKYPNQFFFVHKNFKLEGASNDHQDEDA